MSTSLTRTTSFTIANARSVCSKVKTDLKLVQRAYGDPSDGWIDDYGEEAAQLLNKGYLGTVTYGYRRNGYWVFALSYTARNDGTLAADDRAGQIPRVDTSGASFHSYLTYSHRWDQLTATDRQAVKATLPVQRTSGAEPGTSGGYWAQDKNYSSNGSGVTRNTFRPL